MSLSTCRTKGIVMGLKPKSRGSQGLENLAEVGVFATEVWWPVLSGRENQYIHRSTSCQITASQKK